jgi:hypothetical protein
MRKILLIFSIVFLVINIGYSQKKADIGFMIGGATYIGDVNLETPFHMPRVALKAFYRRNIHTRLAIRGNAGYYRLAGDDSKSGFEYQSLRNHNFQSEILEASVFLNLTS